MFTLRDFFTVEFGLSLLYMMIRFGYSGQWRGWIKACVFRGSLSVLVNGSPTKEINIQRGLKQGDPLAPFLFLLVVEGLSGAIRSAEERNMFTGFKVGNTGLSVSHFQYADDTVFIGEASMENLWSLKAILRSFELASGLKVNFYNSSIMGVNMSSEFLGVTERFLHCRIGSIPFIYLGLHVGANHRKEITWQPLLDTLVKRLRVWRNKYVSLGGRVVLLNSILNSIPIGGLIAPERLLGLVGARCVSQNGWRVRGQRSSSRESSVAW
jgi:hypothetical protein